MHSLSSFPASTEAGAVAVATAAAAAVAAGVVLSAMRMLGRVGAVDGCGDPCQASLSGEDDTDNDNNQQLFDSNGVPCVGNVQCDVGWEDDDLDEDAVAASAAAGKKPLKRFNWEQGGGVWEAYQGLLGVVGLAALPQVGLASLLSAQITANLGLKPGIAGAVLGLSLVVMGRG